MTDELFSYLQQVVTTLEKVHSGAVSAMNLANVIKIICGEDVRVD
jgi:translation initiation factor 2B subunit (eIF-2B alpha/beta/delta family)